MRSRNVKVKSKAAKRSSLEIFAPRIFEIFAPTIFEIFAPSIFEIFALRIFEIFAPRMQTSPVFGS